MLEVHYTPHGKATTDRTRLGIVFSKETPKERVLTLSAVNGTFKIPAGDPNYRVDAEFDIPREPPWFRSIRICTGAARTSSIASGFQMGSTHALRVPAYKWHWQLWYNLDEPITLPKGTKIECTAHFDNSPDNPENPDPTKDCDLGTAKFRRNDGRLLQFGIRRQVAGGGPAPPSKK